MSDLLMRDIYKNFGETKVIHGINIEINDGEFIVILGPSGCGKSTFFIRFCPDEYEDEEQKILLLHL